MQSRHREQAGPGPWLLLLVVLGVLSVVGPTVMAQYDEPQPAVHARLADQALTLDVITTEGGLVAVGARGHVLLSADGTLWHQAEHVPTQATLTRITSADGRLWAVGHDTVIIASDDGGEEWQLQNFEPELEQPLLDVHFFDGERGVAIGAYGLYMTTTDGGESWESETIADRVTNEAIDWEQALQDEAGVAESEDATDTEDGDYPDYYDADTDFDRGCYEFLECHLNRLLALGDGRLMIAAEQGYGYRSTDGGDTWESFRFPYSGSMFGLVARGECIIAFGLRGNVQRSCDFGDSWDLLETESEQSLMGGALAPDGDVVMVGSGAARVTLHPDGRFSEEPGGLGSDYAMVVILEDGSIVLAGEDGLRHDR